MRTIAITTLMRHYFTFRTQSELKFDVNQYESGCYLISLVDIETKIIAVQKLIVR